MNLSYRFPDRPAQAFLKSCLLVFVSSCAALLTCQHGRNLPGRILMTIYGICGLAAVSSLGQILGILLVLHDRSRALKGLPGPEYSLFGLVSALRVKDPHRLAASWADQYGPIIKLRLLFFHAVMITDPALACQVLSSPTFDKFPFLYSFLGPLLGGPNLLSSATDAHWRGIRKNVAPAFSTSHMKEAAQLVVAKSLHLVSILKSKGPGEPFNMDRTLLHVAADVIGEFGFQRDVNALTSIETEGKGGREVSQIDCIMGATLEVERTVQQPLRALDPSKKDERRQGLFLLSQFRGVIDALIDHVRSVKLRKGCFADLLLNGTDPETGNSFDEESIKAETSALFFAGMDTTAHTNTWILFLLSQHPEAEAKVAAELDSLQLLATPDRPNPRPLEYADTSRLPYLQAVIKETLRMYPPLGLGQIRISESDVILGQKLRVPKGTLIWVPHHGIMNTTLNWDEPTSFIPERFLQPGVEIAQRLSLDASWYEGIDLGDVGLPPEEASKRASSGRLRGPKRYFPFAEGPRNCVGQSLAKMSMLGTTATLLSHFTFRLADKMNGAAGVREREAYSLITTIEGGLWMHAIPRV